LFFFALFVHSNDVRWQCGTPIGETEDTFPRRALRKCQLWKIVGDNWPTSYPRGKSRASM
jgi:hypothetical protein